MSVTEGRAIEDFLRYSKAFETLDPRAILPYYHEPCLMISPQGVLSLPNRSDVESFFRDLMSSIQNQGYRSSEFDGLRAVTLSATVAVVMGVGIWRRTDHSELRRFGFTYTLWHADNVSQIAVAIIHDPIAARSSGAQGVNTQEA